MEGEILVRMKGLDRSVMPILCTECHISVGTASQCSAFCLPCRRDDDGTDMVLLDGLLQAQKLLHDWNQE